MAGDDALNLDLMRDALDSIREGAPLDDVEDRRVENVCNFMLTIANGVEAAKVIQNFMQKMLEDLDGTDPPRISAHCESGIPCIDTFDNATCLHSFLTALSILAEHCSLETLVA